MSLKDLILETRSEVLDEGVARAAQEVIPEFFTQGDVAPKYREHLLKSYAEWEGCPPKTDGNGQLRSAEQAQLDRAWQDVAERVDRSEGDIRACVLGVYDGPGEHETRPARLRAEFDEILERAAEERADERDP